MFLDEAIGRQFRALAVEGKVNLTVLATPPGGSVWLRRFITSPEERLRRDSRRQ